MLLYCREEEGGREGGNQQTNSLWSECRAWRVGGGARRTRRISHLILRHVARNSHGAKPIGPPHRRSMPLARELHKIAALPCWDAKGRSSSAERPTSAIGEEDRSSAARGSRQQSCGNAACAGERATAMQRFRRHNKLRYPGADAPPFPGDIRQTPNAPRHVGLWQRQSQVPGVRVLECRGVHEICGRALAGVSGGRE